MIKLISYYKNSNIGVMGRANDKIALLPPRCPGNFAMAAEETLGVEVIATEISGTSLLGPMVAMNNKGLLLPQHAYEKEKKRMKKSDITIEVLKDKYTALGNLLLLNDHGAIASRVFARRSIKAMEDAFDCEVERGKLAGYRTVGSMGVATNRGALVHPLVGEEELEWVEEILGVEVDIGTVNRGVGRVGAGIIANSKGVLVGDETTGPEIARIEESLGFLR